MVNCRSVLAAAEAKFASTTGTTRGGHETVVNPLRPSGGKAKPRFAFMVTFNGGLNEVLEVYRWVQTSIVFEAEMTTSTLGDEGAEVTVRTRQNASDGGLERLAAEIEELCSQAVRAGLLTVD